ncbi:hypothetical protein LK996_12935 [Lysobacter sp. A6]|uniref:DUF4142 domain-containing protein n=1 Tax=Noviluteimonas lactosilytica TaxID=2888523 RepID=A0ABS8JK45_9GAMM|nr:hypothetical protein [Lysobacter lactosilyticus]MCC8363977.1 hypothetical protein [Lysobacter lactosilyticus]
MNAKLLSLSFAMTIALAACAKTETPAADATASNATAAAPAAPTAPVAPEAPAAPAGDIELTMAKVDAWLAASKNLAIAEQSDASLDSAMNASEEDSAKYAARLEATPKLREAIEEAGMSTRDYALTSEALVSTLMAVGAVDAGLVKEIPAEIHPQHVEFVKAHRAEIEKKMQGGAEG